MNSKSLGDVPEQDSDERTEIGQEQNEAVELCGFTELQLFFLLRLGQLLHRRYEMATLLNNDDWRMKALNKAMSSTLCDCVKLGVKDEAEKLFKEEQEAHKS